MTINNLFLKKENLKLWTDFKKNKKRLNVSASRKKIGKNERKRKKTVWIIMISGKLLSILSLENQINVLILASVKFGSGISSFSGS
jgi:hypothetical protein